MAKMNWKKITYSDLSKITNRAELEKLAIKTSRNVYQQQYNLSKAGLGYAPAFKDKTKVLTEKQASKLSNKELKELISKNASKGRLKTFSKKGALEYTKELNESLGTDVRNWSSEDWSKFRKAIEQGKVDGYESEDVVNTFEVDASEVNNAESAREYHNQQYEIESLRELDDDENPFLM